MSDSNLRKQSTSEEKQKRVTLATPLGKEELVVSPPNQRNWRGIFIALLVIAAVLGLIICSILLLSPPDEGPRVRGVHFSLESVMGNKFMPRLFNGTWISELELVYRDNFGNIKMLCVENFTTKSLMTNLTFGQINAVDYRVSADLNYILLMTNIVKTWKYSFQAKYYVYEVATEEYFPLKASEEENEEELPYLESATWAPTGNAIVFIYKNNLYYKSRIRKPQVYTLTRNGVKNVFFNGRPDFLYETKIFQSGTAFWFSSDSTMLAFASFNCSEVGKLQFPYYGTSKYEEMRTIRYPKTGTSNPKVELTIVNMTYPKILKTSIVQPPQIYIKDNDYYLTGVMWITSKEISVTWMNRRQNLTSISVCKQPNWTCTDVIEVCVDSVKSALHAFRGGAERLELCSSLCLGGLTPSLGLFNCVRKLISQKCLIFIMIRSKPGEDYIYDESETDVMAEDIEIFKQNGADGFVFGCLKNNKSVDEEACKKLLEVAKGYPCTFHRAFDVVENPEESLTTISNLGFSRILTSGQEKTAVLGKNLIKRLVLKIEELGSELIIVAGGGVNQNNLKEILEATGVKEYHGSARAKLTTNSEQDFIWITDESVVREMTAISKNFRR